jgi:hypothetical protein
MALDTAVNSQITDSVTQANVKTLGDSPALSLSNLYQIISQSLGLAAQNAVFAQQNSNIIHQTATTQGVNLIYAVDTEAIGDAATKISQAGLPLSMTDMLGAVQALRNNSRGY